MRIIILLILCLLCSDFLQAQKDKHFQLVFHPQFNGKGLQKDSVYVTEKGDSITIETLKLYISKVRFIPRKGQLVREKNSYHLLNWEDTPSMKMQFPSLSSRTKIQAIYFLIGIDSLTNVSGAMGGDLDPTKGMYWTWQNGYINFKIEGKSNSCTTRNHEFQFHLGGYQSPFATQKGVLLSTPSTQISIQNEAHIIIDVAKFFQDIDLSKQNTVMSPGKEAVLLSEKLSDMFYLQKK